MRKSVADSYLKNAHHLYVKGDYQKAIAEYRQALKLDPKCHHALVGIRKAYK